MVDKLEGLVRPIIGIENRSAQEAFDIMADRIRSHFAATPANGEQVERIVEELCAGRDGSQPGPMTAYRQGVRDMALRLATLSTPTEDARERVKVLEEALNRALGRENAWRDALVLMGWARDSYAAALEALMASSGARGTYDAAKYYEATKEAERLLGNKETDRHG